MLRHRDYVSRRYVPHSSVQISLLVYPPWIFYARSRQSQSDLTLSSHLIVFPPSHAHILFAGLALGGAWGFREGARRPLAVANTRLRINSILNAITRRGTFLGNSAGVLGPYSFISSGPPFVLTDTTALVYNGINSSIDSVRGKHDALGSMSAGAMTGILYKSTGAISRAYPLQMSLSSPFFPLAGVRPALAAGTVIAGLAGAWSYVKTRV